MGYTYRQWGSSIRPVQGGCTVTFHTWSDNEHTVPAAAVLQVTLPGGVVETVRTVNGVGTLKSTKGNATVTSLYATLDTSSFTVNGDTVVDIVVTNSQFVDLGLPSGTLWARGNIVKDSQGNYSIGAPEDTGCYFSWGNIVGYNADEIGSNEGQYSFTNANYQLTSGYDAREDMSLGTSLASNDAEHDAAVARLGNGWHMCNRLDYVELFDSNNCTLSLTTVNGVDGILITSNRNNNTLFMPVSGYYEGITKTQNTYVYIWGTTVYSTWNGYYLSFCIRTASTTVNISQNAKCYTGIPIRPVL